MRRLPIIKYKRVEYFVDERLHEFRSNTRLIDFVSFNSEKGQRIQKYGISEDTEMKIFLFKEIKKLEEQLHKQNGGKTNEKNTM